MNDADLKKFTQVVRGVVKEEVKELIRVEVRGIVKEEVNGAVKDIKQDLEGVKGSMKSISEDLESVKRTQEQQVLPSVITTETILKGYADAYKTNKANIERLDDRVTRLEDDAGIVPSSEFTIQR